MGKNKNFGTILAPTYGCCWGGNNCIVSSSVNNDKDQTSTHCQSCYLNLIIVFRCQTH